MALTSTISAYNIEWPAWFDVERDRITPVFHGELLRIHHVGSTAVPTLAAKPEIDLLVEVFDHRNVKARDIAMQTLGYIRGKDISAGHHFFRRDVEGVRTHKVHVCVTGHWQIERMLRFRDLLRTSAAVRQQYEALKLHLEATNQNGIGEYLAGKAPFINKLLGPPQG